jgi:hypothetical protein
VEFLLDDLDEIRRQISLYARRKDSRIIPNSIDRPCRWTPTEVENPASGLVFTTERAWIYIAELAESGHPLEEMILDRPPGEKAYVMKIPLVENVSELYIKIQIEKNKIWGRSFHYSIF